MRLKHLIQTLSVVKLRDTLDLLREKQELGEMKRTTSPAEAHFLVVDFEDLTRDIHELPRRFGPISEGDHIVDANKIGAAWGFDGRRVGVPFLVRREVLNDGPDLFSWCVDGGGAIECPDARASRLRGCCETV